MFKNLNKYKMIFWDSWLRLFYQMLLLQDYICSCGAIKTEVQLNAESVTLSACFSILSGRGRCFDTFYFVSLWRAEQSMSHGNFEGGQSRGSHVTRPALPGPLNRRGQDRMLWPDPTGGGPSNPTEFHPTLRLLTFYCFRTSPIFKTHPLQY